MQLNGGILTEDSPQIVPVADYISDNNLPYYPNFDWLTMEDGLVPTMDNYSDTGCLPNEEAKLSTPISQDTFYELKPIKTENSQYNDFKSCQALKAEDYLYQRVKNDETFDYAIIKKVQSLAVEQASKDIEVSCNYLGISHDPMNWSLDDVKAWITWTIQQYSLPSIPWNYFAVDGMALCAMTENDFRARVPEAGDTLFAYLDIWKTAANIKKEDCSLASGGLSMEESYLDMNNFFHWSTTEQQSSNNQNSLVPESVIIKNETGSEDERSQDDGIERHSPLTTHNHIHLWQFLKELLNKSQSYGCCIRWIDRSKGIFKIEDSVRVAKLWGKRKNRPAMNYDKLSRSIRQYYKKGIMKKTERSQRLVYQFCHPYCL